MGTPVLLIIIVIIHMEDDENMTPMLKKKLKRKKRIINEYSRVGSNRKRDNNIFLTIMRQRVVVGVTYHHLYVMKIMIEMQYVITINH